MADRHSVEGSSTSNVAAETSDSTLELNIKTQDSQMYTFHVEKNIPVSLFKEKIATEIGVPVTLQRLIFRGKVLKDDHLLSEYNVENGHTLHLVVRQPSQPQSSAGTIPTGTNESSANMGPEGGDDGSRTRVGQFSHSVVLGTFNVGDQGESSSLDLSRVIGAVLNSFGIGNQGTVNGTGGSQPIMQSNAPAQAPQGNETEGIRVNVGNPSQAANQSQRGHMFAGQSVPQVLQIPIGRALPVPSLNSPIPDSLNTLSEFMNRMELALSHDAAGYQPNQSVNSTGDLPTVELPANAQGLSTPEALAVVLRHSIRLLIDHAVASLSHIAGRLEQEQDSTDPTIRAQIQTESMQVGIAAQHLGALFLELGRTMLTLRMGQTPAESTVNAGPAVYISPSGPNPIMVQPLPLQTSSLFGSSAASPLNPVAFSAGVGAVPRHVNIHIHTAVGPRATSGEGMQGDHVNGSSSGESGQTRVLPLRNAIATTVPPRAPVLSVSTSQPGFSFSQPPPDPAMLSTVLAGINSRIRNFVDNMQNETHVLRGQSEASAVQDQSVGHHSANEEGSNHLRNPVGNEILPTHLSSPPCASESEGHKTQCDKPSNKDGKEGHLDLKDVPSSNSAGDTSNSLRGETSLKSVDDTKYAPRSNQGTDNAEGVATVPLGLGLAGLQPKRRSRLGRARSRCGDNLPSNAPPLNHNQNQNQISDGQQVLQSLASLANRRNANTPPSGQRQPAVEGFMESIPSRGHDASSQFDPASVMEVLQSPALDGLLAGVSQQTGVGSPDVLRNMLGQVAQNPAMMNAVSQFTQQIGSQDLGTMFSGLGSSEGGGIDLSRMVQQMMPIVSQALSGGSTLPQQVPVMERRFQPLNNERRSGNNEKPDGQNSQIDLQPVVRRVEDSPGQVFRSLVESAVDNSGVGAEVLVEELSTNPLLASEFMEMMCRDISRRLQDEAGS